MDQLTEPKLDSKSFSHHCAVIPLNISIRHSNLIPTSFQCHFIIVPVSFQCTRHQTSSKMERLKNGNCLVPLSFNFRTRSNDEWFSFDGTTERSRSENRCPDWRSLNLTHNHSRIIARSFRYYPNSPFQCHSDIIPMSFHHRSGVVSVHEAWGNFWDGTNHKRKLLSFHSRLI